MSDKHLSREPHRLRGTSRTWWYEESHGLTVVHEFYVNDTYQRTDQIKIPWRTIRKALERKDR